MIERTDWGARQHSQVDFRLGRSEEFRCLRHYLRAQSQGYHTIDRLGGRGGGGIVGGEGGAGDGRGVWGWGVDRRM